MSDATTLALSTRIKPARKFLVDGVEYEMWSMDHLSKEDEAMVMALFARHSIIGQELEMSPNVNAGVKSAQQLRTCRMSLLTKLTSLTHDVAAKLPIGQQALLLDALEEEMAPPQEGEDEAVEGTQAAPEASPGEDVHDI